MGPLQAYATFVRTFEAGSFSAVARETGTTQSAVSKQIASLEASLGIQLFARSTRRLQPTHEALQLYEHVRQLLEAVDALRTTTGREATPSGTLRITMPSAYGRRIICPQLPMFLTRFPQVSLDIVLSDQAVDLIEDGFELAIRIGDLAPSSLMARSLGALDHRLVATPQYLAERGRPDVPTDLAEHRCVLYANSGHWTRWEFESETGRHIVEVKGPIRVNDPEAMFELVKAHQGIALIPSWMLGDAIPSGQLEWLLQDYYPTSMPINVVYPQTRFLSSRARCFIDFLVAPKRAD